MFATTQTELENITPSKKSQRKTKTVISLMRGMQKSQTYRKRQQNGCCQGLGAGGKRRDVVQGYKHATSREITEI